MSGLRIHMSYDLAHDRDLHDQLSKQAKQATTFVIASRSEGGEITSAWSERVRESIAEADELIVICGEHTDESLHVSAELKIAQEQNKPYVLLWGRRDSMCKKPRSARPDEGMYCWTPSILERQLVYGLRRSRDLEVPEGMKRQVPTPRATPPLP